MAVLQALDADKLDRYVCDFPSADLNAHGRVSALPHLSASTREAEENCAVMVVDPLRDYLEHGNVGNAVNFPALSMARKLAYRLALANANVPNMLGQISTTMAHAGLNTTTGSTSRAAAWPTPGSMWTAPLALRCRLGWLPFPAC